MGPWRKKSSIPDLLKDDPPRLIERLLVAAFMILPGILIGAVILAMISGISIPPTVLQSIALIAGGIVGASAGFAFPRSIIGVFSSIGIGN